ncbi:COG3904 family protein [Rhizobium halophilum]|uniref:COG3904 family protein n=1 Tax=Rhizobium halophilum TaxID=2846852 RepID=UPI00374D9826
MRPPSLALRLKETFLRTDDGALMRYAFFSLLAAAGIFVAIDVRELSLANANLPGHDPMHTDAPVLPPALTDGVPQAPPVQPESPPEVLRQPMRFELLSGGTLRAEGSIDLGAAVRFAEEIEARGEYVKSVALNSPGGSVDDALAMSMLIREKGLNTRVASKALCASSCPIVFAGGVSREADKDAVVGVHQVFNAGQARPSPEQAMSGAQSTTARIARHLDEMGIGAGLWINALETPPDRLYYLTVNEMTEFKLTTDAVATAKQ